MTSLFRAFFYIGNIVVQIFLWCRIKRCSLLWSQIIRRQAVLKLLLGYFAESIVICFTVIGYLIDAPCYRDG